MMIGTTRLERRDPLLYVVAEWEEAEDSVSPVGPRRFAVEVAAGQPGGIGADVLRRAERHLDDMIGEFNELPAVGGRGVMVRRYVEDRLAGLPATGDGYHHRGLLEIHADLVARGHEEPVNALATAMRVPEEVAQSCLQMARRRLNLDA